MVAFDKILHGREPVRSSRITGFVVTAALHLVAVVALLHYEPIRSALTEAAPIMVSLITPVVERPEEPPKPLPVKLPIKQPKPVEPQPLITAASEEPAPVVPPPPLPQPMPVEAAPPKAIIAEVPAPSPSPEPMPVAPPIIAPNFNADYLENPPPAYPALSRRIGEQGRVVLRVLVNVNGSADKVELRTSSGFIRLDDAALDTVRRWRFAPARQGNQPVAAWVLIPITFTLKG